MKSRQLRYAVKTNSRSISQRLLACVVLSPRPWKFDAVLRLMSGVFLCLLVGTLVATLTRGGTDGKAAPGIRHVVISAICLQGAAIAFVWRFVREHGITWSEGFGLHHAPLRAIALATIAIAVFLPFGWGLQVFSLNLLDYLGIKATTQHAVQALHGAEGGVGLLTFAVVIVVIAPLGEELLFRGVLYPTIKRAGFPKLALWGSSLLFASIHLNLSAFLPLLLLALVLVWLYEQTDNLIAPLAAHALFNAINLATFFINNDTVVKLPVRQ